MASTMPLDPVAAGQGVESSYLDLHDEEGPWLGASGKEYVYYVFPRDMKLPARMGIYIYARRNEEHYWVPIYMGQGDLSTLCVEYDLLRKIDNLGATHVHARINTLKSERLAELRDLLTHYKNAFPPDGCNRPSDIDT